MTQATTGGMTFAYQARTLAGQKISGTIDATDAEQARQSLAGLKLEIDQLRPARKPLLAMPLSAGDFQAFNQQLAQLARAGLPVEQGLKLVAQEMRRGRLRRAVQATVEELERGKTLSQAIEGQRSQFPPLYARVIDAGIRAGNLSDILLNLGRHLALTRRLRAMLWQTISYPLFVMVFFLAMVVFVLKCLVPGIFDTYRTFHAELPLPTQLLLAESDAVNKQLIFLAAIVVLGGIIWVALRGSVFVSPWHCTRRWLGPSCGGTWWLAGAT
jgi:type II secretory pathway component PulF